MRKITKEISKDVAVIGGGMAGVSAAMAAAKAGCSVLLIERLSYLGGLATAGLVTPMMGAVGGGKKIISGNMDIILKRLHEKKACVNTSYDQEMMKYALDEVITERNIDIYFDTFIFDAESEDKKIKQVIGVNKSGIITVKAKIFIDTSGDADLVNLISAPYSMGRESDGLVQAVTLRFNAGNIETEKALKFINSDEGRLIISNEINKFQEEHNVELNETGFQCFSIPGKPGTLAFNNPRITGIIPINAEDINSAYIDGRKRIQWILAILRACVPGCRNVVILNTAQGLGIRETRRLQGKYVITADDVSRGRKFHDGIAGNAWYCDIHDPKGKGILGGVNWPESGWNDIPYRSLYSSEIKNMLVAGRCISATHEAQAAVRIMPTCIATGQAAGVAAAIASINGINVADVNTNKLRSKLVDDGALITGINL